MEMTAADWQAVSMALCDRDTGVPLDTLIALTMDYRMMLIALQSIARRKYKDYTTEEYEIIAKKVIR